MLAGENKKKLVFDNLFTSQIHLPSNDWLLSGHDTMSLLNAYLRCKIARKIVLVLKVSLGRGIACN